VSSLDLIIQEQGIELSDARKLVEAFGGPFEEAGEVLANYKEIVVTDESQVDLMAEAKKRRLILKKARTTAENNRKELKSDIIKQGRAIDSVAKFIKNEIEPAEQYLELQEKFIQIQEEKRIAELKASRIDVLSNYEDVNLNAYNLESMTTEEFDQLVDSLDTAKKAKEELAIKQEEERKAAAEAERKRQEKRDREAAELREKLRVQEEEAAKVKAKADKLEKEKRDQEKAEADAKAKAMEEELKAQQSPDKDKIIAYVDAFKAIPIPAVSSPDAVALITRIRGGVEKLSNNILKEVESL
jgi:phage-related minor tail protein